MLTLALVPLIIWTAVWIYLWNLDLRVKRLEEEARDNNSKDGLK